MAEERLVWGSEKFIDAILDDMRAAAQLFEMDETEITPLTQQYINEEKLSVANHVDFIDVYQETLDRTDLPEGMSKAKAADEILMFVEAAQYEQRTQGTGKINGLTIPELGVTDVQAQDPEFKKLFTKQFTDTPTNAPDKDIVIKGIFTSRATNPKGPSLIYADVEEIFDFVEYNRREAVATDASNETIDAIKETIKQKGYVYDTGEYMNSGVAFPVSVDVSGDIQIAEGNHRLIAAYEVAQETGKKIYVPIYVYPSGVNKNPFINQDGGTYKGRSRNVGKEKLYKALRQLFIDSGASEYSVNEKVGETLGATKQYTGTNYLGSGGTGGNSVSQENMKKFFDAIGIETLTYEELPEDNVFKTGLSQFADTPTNVVDDADVYYHSRLGEIDNAQDIHFGTYDAALDRASLQYGKESVQSFYARALDEAYDLFREEVEVLELVDDGFGNFKLPYKSRQFNFELENKAIPPKSQEWTFEYITEGETIRLNYIADDGFETLIDEFYVETIDYEGADVKKLGDLDVEDIIGSKKGFRELEGHIQALQEGQPVDVYKGKFDFGSKYNLYKTTIKPDAKVFDMSGQDIEITELVRKRGESKLSPKTNTVSSEFLQYRLFGEDAPELRNISEIKIDSVSYKPKGNVFSSNDEIIEIISNNADVVAYTNEIEDAGSTSIYVRNADAVEVSLAGEQEITDFNKDVRKKYVETSVVDEQMNLIKAADRGDISTEELDELIEIRKPKPEPALLETNIKFENVMVDDDTPRGYKYVQQNPRWSNEVIKPNKIFNPDKFETRYKRADQTFKSGQEIVDAILSGTATDEDITRFFIFAASKSDGQAWGYGKKWSSADAIADIVKIGIFSDRNLKRVIPVDDSYLFSRMKDMMKMSGGYELPNEIFLDMANEQGQFTNLKERMRNVILDAHNKIYAKNPNDYFILWRGGNLSRFNTWQSFSKRQEAARGVMIQLKFSGVEQGGGMGTYVINKNNMIDLDALGLSHGREQEVIVLAEAANKPGAKLANNITTPENLKTYTDNWALRATEPEFFPKQGFVIQNISQQLNQLGQPTQDFFTEVIQGMDKHAPLKAYEPIIQFENAQLDAAQDIYNKFVIQGGDFNQHIFTSIPTFYETQIVKAVALNNMLQNFEKQKKVTVLDIGATEGTWSKLLGSLNENLQIDVLEPNPAAEDIFNQTDQVENVRFQKNAFSYLPEDQGKFFLEEGGRRNIKFINFGAGEDVQFKYDVVHESMTFQFLDNNRKAQIDFIAENVLNDNGFLILEEKFSSDDVVYQANEELKNDFKKQYYSEAQINTKQHEVITSMGKNQVAVRDMENILNSKFKYVQQYWDAGNFKGYIASNNPLAETFVEEIYKTDVSLTGHEFSTNPTEQEIKFSVQKQMDNKFINKELAKELTKQTLESSKEFINKSSDAVQTIFKNVKSVGGVGLALGLKGLSKAAPVLEPGDVLIEKGIEKFSPQLNKAAQKLGFASLPVQKILPTYVALEIGIAAAELVQAAMYAYEASQEKAPGKPISNLQESLTRFLLPKSVEDEAINRLRYKENVMRDFYNTPTGKAVLEEVDFGSQLLNQLGEERVARYSPGWNLSKAIFGLFGTIGTAISGEQANISEQTRDNMGQALLTGIGK